MQNPSPKQIDPPTQPLPEARPLPHPEGPPPARIHGVFDRILTIIFLLAITAPLLGTYFHWDFASQVRENRNLAPFPEAPGTYKELTKLPDAYFDYFKDHFGFRNVIIKNFQDLRWNAGLIHRNDQVLIGKDNWLFLSVRPDQGYTREKGFEPFTPAELALWQYFFEQRQKYFASRGIKYVTFFAPDKQSIYPEYLPKGLEPVGPSRLDQLIAHLKQQHSPVVMVDVRPAILAEKERRLVEYKDTPWKRYTYFKTDTHWNEYGAFAAYREVLKAVQEQMPEQHFTPQTLDEYKELYKTNFSADMVPMLGLEHQISETAPSLLRKVTYLDSPTTRKAHDEGKRPRLLFYHDSFGNSLHNFFGPHFGGYCRDFVDAIDLDLLESEKPDIVISELVERKLYGPLPMDPKEINRFGLDK